jgi:hypothetical protein
VQHLLLLLLLLTAAPTQLLAALQLTCSIRALLQYLQQQQQRSTWQVVGSIRVQVQKEQLVVLL